MRSGVTGSTRFDSTSEAWTSLGSAARSLSTSCSVFLRCQKAVLSSHRALLSSASGVVIVCGPALTWGLYGVGRDSAGMGTTRVAAQRRALPLVIRWALRVARGSPRGRVRGGIGVCFLLPIRGARAAPRDAPRVPGQPRMRARGWGGGLSRVVVTWLLLCCSVYCRRSRLSNNGASSSSAQQLVSGIRQPVPPSLPG